MKITIIGLSGDENPQLAESLIQLIARGVLFAGGERHRKLVAHLLPQAAQWHNIVVPLSSLFEAIDHSNGDWIVFASGDPLFFGIGNTLLRQFPKADISVFPAFNSLQQLAHHRAIAYGEATIVTLTGRPWNKLDGALIAGDNLIGLLTDRTKTPSAIATRMLAAGYSNYSMVVGEKLGACEEKIYSLSLDEAAEMRFSFPNCLYLQKQSHRQRFYGIPDEAFEGLPNRPKMITKAPIRLTSLALLQLHSKTVLWDVGACTGSISIEAKLQAPHLDVIAFEKRVESKTIVENNCRTFGTPGIDYFEGDFLEIDKSTIKRPDAVFLGGYGGKMSLVLDEINRFLLPSGIICFNAVSAVSAAAFKAWGSDNNFKLTHQTHLTVDSYNPITILVIAKQDQ